jgi:hypothetical protein
MTSWISIDLWPDVPLASGVALLTWSIWSICKRRSPASVFWAGVALIFFGVFGPLFGSVYMGSAAPPVHDFMRDLFLIIAAIGANWVASAVLAFESRHRLLPAALWNRWDRRRPTAPDGDGEAHQSSVLVTLRRESVISPSQNALQPKPPGVAGEKRNDPCDGPNNGSSNE